MGLGLYFAEGEGPRFERPLRDEAAIARLAAPDPQGTALRAHAVRETRRALDGLVPLIGFAGTLYARCYMSRLRQNDWRRLRNAAHPSGPAAHAFSRERARGDRLPDAQVEARTGVMCSTLGAAAQYGRLQEFSLAYMRKVLAALRPVPSIVFTKGGGAWLESIAASGCSAVGLDWTVDPRDARTRIGQKVALQGNLDPAVLTGPDASVREQARRVLDGFGAAPGHIFNLGHGISPSARPDAVAALVDEVRAYSTKLRGHRH